MFSIFEYFIWMEAFTGQAVFAYNGRKWQKIAAGCMGDASMARKMSVTERLGRATYDKMDLNRTVLNWKKSIDDINKALGPEKEKSAQKGKKRGK